MHRDLAQLSVEEAAAEAIRFTLTATMAKMNLRGLLLPTPAESMNRCY
jgi:hypothetical protein